MSAFVLPSQPSRGRGLLCIAELNQWERRHVPYIQSTTGRDLYFALAHSSLLQDNPCNVPLKTLLMGVTERALRQRVREFERLGLITLRTHDSDTRVRTAQPTPKLLAMFDAHTRAMRQIFQKRFAYTPL